MRKLGRLAFFGLLIGSMALADPNDFKIQQLGNPTSTDTLAAAVANLNFAGFAREFGAALVSANLMPPATLGHAGFNVSAELTTAFIDGALNPSDRQFLFPTIANFDNRGPLLLPSIHIRKGLPFSFELGMRASLIDKSQMGSALGEVRFGVNEGFYYLPDVCLRAYTMRLFNTKDFDLGVTGLDVGVGKRFAIGGMVTLHPYAGWNLMWVGAKTGLVDFSPERTYEDSVSSRPAQLRTSVGEFREVAPLDNLQHRFYGGVRFIGGIVQIGGEVSYTAVGNVKVNATGGGVNTNKDFPPVLALNATLGLDF
jgi:hypothetical protein